MKYQKMLTEARVCGGMSNSQNGSLFSQILDVARTKLADSMAGTNADPAERKRRTIIGKLTITSVVHSLSPVLHRFKASELLSKKARTGTMQSSCNRSGRME